MAKNYLQILDEKSAGKTYRNRWNKKLYRTVATNNGVEIELCDSETVNEDTIITIGYE